MTVRWGILGTATIAREAVLPAMQQLSLHKRLALAGIASRDLARAEQTADAFGVERAYGSYESLLDDDSIDAVYIPLPNHLHVPYAKKALDAGKHVLCEKPIALNASEAEELVLHASRSPHLKLMEAFMYRLHPQWQWARAAVAEGRIGKVRSIHSFFSFYEDDPDCILQRPDWGGGGLMDVGCYSVSLSRYLFDSEPIRVAGVLHGHETFPVDSVTSGWLEFSAGTATFTCSTEIDSYQSVQVFGAEGRLEIPIPFNPPPDEPARVVMTTSGECIEKVFPACDQYGIQMDRFSQAILDDTPPPIAIDDAVKNMTVLDALRCEAGLPLNRA